MLRTAIDRFADRHAAGRELGDRLRSLALEEPVVFGVARGGIPVAYEVAQALDAPLEVLVVRKIGAPGNPELGIGAIAEGDVRVLDREIVRRLLVSPEELEVGLARARAEVRARVERYRGGRPPVDVRGRTAVVVDDGLATGGTARAALRAVSELLANEIADPPPGEDDPPSSLRLSAREVRIPGAEIVGDLVVPSEAVGLVVFSHGSGSSRFSPRNRQVARTLHDHSFATLLLDLLKGDEERDRANVFDLELLSNRLVAATLWVRDEPELRDLPLGYFGASTGAAAALRAAAQLPGHVGAVVSRGGRPDLAAPWLSQVRAPVLLIVGSRDEIVLELNREAQHLLAPSATLAVVPGATHLFEEPGKLEEVSLLAATWFERHLTVSRPERRAGAASAAPR